MGADRTRGRLGGIGVVGGDPEGVGGSGGRVLTGGLGEDRGAAPGANVRGYSGRPARFCVGTRTREGIRKDTEESPVTISGGVPPGRCSWGVLGDCVRGARGGRCCGGCWGEGSWGMLGRVLECRTVDNDDGDENEERETASLTMQCMTSNNMLQGKLEQENHLREHQTLTLKI